MPKWLDDIGKWGGKAVQDVGGFVFGTPDDPGLLGTAQRKVTPAQIPGYEGFQSQFAAGAEQAGGRQDLSPFRQQQRDLAAALEQQSFGVGPSLAQMQLQQATDKNMAQAMALGQSQMGAGRAGGLRQIANQRAGIGQQMASDAGMLRLQEQMQARGMLGGVLGQGRAADQQQVEMNDRMVQFYLSQGADMAQAQNQANIDVEQMKAQEYGRAAEARGKAFDRGVGAIKTIATKGRA